MSTTAKKVDGTDTPGQMIRDFAARTANNGQFNVKWVFSPEALDGKSIAEAKKIIADRIIKLMKEDAGIREVSQKALNKSGIKNNEWNRFIDGVPGEKGFADDLVDNFIEIDSYNNIKVLTGI